MTATQNAIWQQWLANTKPVLPVIVIEQLADAVPLAQALVAGGIHMLEITLRTEHGLAAIEQIRQQVPQAIVGAGTVLNSEQFQAAINSGAQFVVSPGITPELLSTAQQWGGAYLPGVASASEVMQALAAGFSYQKLFPAQVVGGLAAVKAFAGPFGQVSFCPTGGVDANNAAHYLAQSNVFAVGGSWLTPKELVRAKRWDAITELALSC